MLFWVDIYMNIFHSLNNGKWHHHKNSIFLTLKRHFVTKKYQVAKKIRHISCCCTFAKQSIHKIAFLYKIALQFKRKQRGVNFKHKNLSHYKWFKTAFLHNKRLCKREDNISRNFLSGVCIQMPTFYAWNDICFHAETTPTHTILPKLLSLNLH